MQQLKKRGFTLIEVLITLVILIFGLLGIAGLMSKGQRASYEAYQRGQAVTIASDMAERIRANRTQALAYAAGAPTTAPVGIGTLYNQLLGNSLPTNNCGLFNCSTTALVNYDLAQWDGLLLGYPELQATGAAKIGTIIKARGCIEQTANTAASCTVSESGHDRTHSDHDDDNHDDEHHQSNVTRAATKFFTRNLRVSVAWQGNDDTTAPTTSSCGAGLYGAEAKRRVISLDVIVQIQC